MPTKQTFTSGQVLTAQQMSDLQDYIGVVQITTATKNDTFSTSSTSYVDVTGLSVSITPTSASNKIIFMASMGTVGNSLGGFVTLVQLLRGSTVILAPSGGASPATGNMFVGANNDTNQAMSLTVVDSPATTSATTYKVQMRVSGGTGFINRLSANADFTTVTQLIAMEVTP
jgi:hypothetical protein